MPLNAERVRSLLFEFDFKKLFIDELGWDRYDATLDLSIDSQAYNVKAIAEKRGVQIFECSASAEGTIPDYKTRRKIDHQITKAAFEHLIIFTDRNNGEQIWQWVAREPGKTTAYREYPIHRGQSGDTIIQKLRTITFPLSDEEGINVLGVVSRLRDAFDRDRVTRRFYDRFKDEHAAFLRFIDGIPDEDLQRWYASVMINRLMFIYFIQKRGFLNGDADYLQNKLRESKRKGKNLFYKDVLSPLFFEGFARKKEHRTPAINRLLGNIPYLNGGLFLKHQIEEQYGKTIVVPDRTFDKLFAFFDQYEWHLDDRPISTGNEINPDVLGYIFEKYINQKELGAYYTKEDITGYISQNTIIPYLFDATKQKCKIAFEGEHSLWELLKENPDGYIYETVHRGVIDEAGKVIPESKLPDFAQKGMHDPKARMFDRHYNLGDAQLYDEKANKLTLPTETWREYVERRKRCLELHQKLTAGEICDINDLITYNLNIRQFAQDVVENCEGPDLLSAFWRSIESVTVLDPTCGSGAFLFAALNTLEALYEACLERMQAFLLEWGEKGKKPHPNYYKSFVEILERVGKHPNTKYFIYKSIILNNLYGVDILEEAVEICKLRLFLKLAAQIEPDPAKENYGIEPLPDIDFNIRAGNTLVGFVTREDVRKAVEVAQHGQAKLVFEEEQKIIDRIEEEAENADRAFKLFHTMQTMYGMDHKEFLDAKGDLRRRLRSLEKELNEYLATEYGKNPKNKAEYEEWLSSHKPFHWFINFYRIMKQGGFDVIIGNPPYVEYAQVRDSYAIQDYTTDSCGNLYAYVIERGFGLMRLNGLFGMIVQLPIVCTDRMIPLQTQILRQSKSVWFADFDDRPAKLFDGLQHIRATVFTAQKGATTACRIFSTTYNRWYTELRPTLFHSLAFQDVSNYLMLGAIPKIGTEIAKRVHSRSRGFIQLGMNFIPHSRSTMYYHNSPQYWIRAMDFAPHFWNQRAGRQISGQVKTLFFSSKTESAVVSALLNSSLFYWWFILFSDCRHLVMREIISFPMGFDRMNESIKNRLTELSGSLMNDYRLNSRRKRTEYKTTGKVVYDEFYPALSKPIIDEIDCVLAKHYGFTDDELDFIINYDIKYRMGRENAEEQDG